MEEQRVTRCKQSKRTDIVKAEHSIIYKGLSFFGSCTNKQWMDDTGYINEKSRQSR